MSGEATEVVVERIHDYLGTVGKSVRAGQVLLEDFIIHKRLGKDPKDYPDAKAQPHVQVALRQRQKGGRDYKAGDVVPYIFCRSADAAPSEASRTAQADRARHPDEVRRAESGFVIGALGPSRARPRAVS